MYPEPCQLRGLDQRSRRLLHRNIIMCAMEIFILEGYLTIIKHLKYGVYGVGRQQLLSLENTSSMYELIYILYNG